MAMIVVDEAQAAALSVAHAECDSCGGSTEDGCIRNLRVTLLGSRKIRLTEVSMREFYFCRVACARATALALVQEINNGTDADLVPDLKRMWRGQVLDYDIQYALVKRSADDSGPGSGG